jgi:hypothetical protein
MPKRQAARLGLNDPKAQADVEDNFRKTIGQLIGGGAVLVGAAIAYMQFQQQQRASRDLLISNQISKGFEQLASSDLRLRVGGIYILEGVMNTSEQYHQPVLEALCTFVHDETQNVTSNPPPATDIQPVRAPIMDVHPCSALAHRVASEAACSASKSCW